MPVSFAANGRHLNPSYAMADSVVKQVRAVAMSIFHVPDDCGGVF
jgi:hypothetical protein